MGSMPKRVMVSVENVDHRYVHALWFWTLTARKPLLHPLHIMLTRWFKEGTWVKIGQSRDLPQA